jgi:hypothetical protein
VKKTLLARGRHDAKVGGVKPHIGYWILISRQTYFLLGADQRANIARREIPEKRRIGNNLGNNRAVPIVKKRSCAHQPDMRCGEYVDMPTGCSFVKLFFLDVT